jgi:hypothetical protein
MRFIAGLAIALAALPSLGVIARSQTADPQTSSSAAPTQSGAAEAFADTSGPIPQFTVQQSGSIGGTNTIVPLAQRVDPKVSEEHSADQATK